jgi:ADP-ribosylglycohydrolase
MTAYHKIIDGIANGDAIGGPTALAEIIAESLIANSGLNTADITSRYLEWWRGGSFDTGPTFVQVFKLIDSGMGPSAAVETTHGAFRGNSAGCGPAHRNSVIAACTAIQTDNVPDAARAEALITHLDPVAGDAAAVVALLCRCLLNGLTLEAAKVFVAEHPRTSEAFASIMLRPLGPSGFALDAVRAAIYFMDGKYALKEASAFAGASNYCPVIVGALLGARCQLTLPNLRGSQAPALTSEKIAGNIG